MKARNRIKSIDKNKPIENAKSSKLNAGAFYSIPLSNIVY